MKNITKLLMLLAFTSFFAISCGKSGPDPIKIEGLDTYTDNVTGFSIKYPKNWVKSEIPGGRFVVFTNNEGRKRFNKYDTEGFPGAKIDLIVTDLNETITLDSIMKKSRLFGPEVYESADVTIDGVPGKKLIYSFPLQGGMFNGMMFFGTKDNQKATILTIEAFDNSYENEYKDAFNEIIASLKLATKPEAKKADTLTITEEAPPPSSTLDERTGDGFTIGIPDNFKSENIGKSGSALKAWSFLGTRRGDSFIKVETFDASKQKDLKKIVEENRASFGNANPVSTTLGGASAYVLNYQASKTVKGKVWFAIKNDKMYRLTINWFTGEEKDFLPVFEKSVQSFKFQ